MISVTESGLTEKLSPGSTGSTQRHHCLGNTDLKANSQGIFHLLPLRDVRDIGRRLNSIGKH